MKTEALIKFSTLLDLTNILSESQKNQLIEHLLKEKKQPKETILPISIFNTKLSCLETISKYLKENLNLNFIQISKLLNREPTTIRTTYNNAVKKHNLQLDTSNYTITIPLKFLKNRKYSTFELLIIYLKENSKLKTAQIATLLNRNYKTIWTTYQRAIKK